MKGKEVNSELKKRIAFFYQNSNFSVGAIASALDISRNTVIKYKDLKLPKNYRRENGIE